jgi:hypothetical protein
MNWSEPEEPLGFSRGSRDTHNRAFWDERLQRNQESNNQIWDCGLPLTIADPENISDANVFATSKEPFDLAAWQVRTGWDKSFRTATLQATFDLPTRFFSLRPTAPARHRAGHFECGPRE